MRCSVIMAVRQTGISITRYVAIPDVCFRPILLKNSVPEQGRHVTRQPEADLFDQQ